MKKMSVRNKNEKDFDFFAYSDNKGIFMRAEKVEKSKQPSIFSQIRYPEAYACITEDGTIKVNPENLKQIQEQASKVTERRGKVSNRLRIIFFVTWMVTFVSMIFTSFIHEYLPFAMCAISLICLGFSNMPMIVYCAFKKLVRDKEYIQLTKFHSAEHAAINAYNDLNRVPTMEEIKKYSNFSYDCGTLENIKRGWPYVLLGLCRFVPGTSGLILVLIAAVFSLFTWKKNLYFLEIVTLSKPSDYEYDAAIKAMTEAIKMKEESEDLFGIIQGIILDDIGNCSGIIEMEKIKGMVMVQFEGNLEESS